jgi:outer membrane protein assembly factor BamA
MVSVEGRAERVKITAREGHGYDAGKREIRSLVLRSLMDTLDRFPFPSKGHMYSAYLEIGEPIFGGTETFRKTFFSLASYRTIWRLLTLYARGVLGVSEGPLPFSEQFLIGGEETLYGYRDDELRGNKLFLVNMGYRLRLAKRLYFGTRYDVGNVWEHELQIKWGSTRHAIGINLALDTPLGPIKATYGRASDGRGRVYFSAGYRF